MHWFYLLSPDLQPHEPWEFHRNLVYFQKIIISCDVHAMLNDESLGSLWSKATAALHVLLSRPMNRWYQLMEWYCSVNAMVSKMPGLLIEPTAGAYTGRCSVSWLSIHKVIPWVVASMTVGGVFIEIQSVCKVRRVLFMVSISPGELQDNMCYRVSSVPWPLGQRLDLP